MYLDLKRGIQVTYIKRIPVTEIWGPVEDLQRSRAAEAVLLKSDQAQGCPLQILPRLVLCPNK